MKLLYNVIMGKHPLSVGHRCGKLGSDAMLDAVFWFWVTKRDENLHLFVRWVFTSYCELFCFLAIPTIFVGANMTPKAVSTSRWCDVGCNIFGFEWCKAMFSFPVHTSLGSRGLLQYLYDPCIASSLWQLTCSHMLQGGARLIQQ